jgi:SpoVK/Ycf46/Vps4 family AAA+-type ATPase
MVEDDPTTLVFVLVDEVESLASTRGGCGTNGDPADATRAVNALLTSLDRLRRFPNVMVLTTTNLTSSVDGAFLDRVDLKVHIGNPNLEAREMVLRSAVEELKRVGIVVTDIDFERRRVMDHDIFHEEHKEEGSNVSRDLSETEDSETSLLSSCAFLAEGLSGRALRRLPLQAFSQFLGGVECPVSSTEFLNALSSAIRAELHARESL